MQKKPPYTSTPRKQYLIKYPITIDSCLPAYYYTYGKIGGKERFIYLYIFAGGFENYCRGIITV
jgi:hypothetical protein